VTTMGRLANKPILLTGGNSGIGLAAAQEFDREGARVAICGLNEGTLQDGKARYRSPAWPHAPRICVWGHAARAWVSSCTGE